MTDGRRGAAGEQGPATNPEAARGRQQGCSSRWLPVRGDLRHRVSHPDPAPEGRSSNLAWPYHQSSAAAINLAHLAPAQIALQGVICLRYYMPTDR
jgi:hypothetical protein